MTPLESDVQRTTRGIEPRWPSSRFWWCVTCGEPSGSDPCEFCGNPIERYNVVRAEVTDEMVDRGAEAAFFQDDLGGHIKGRWTWATIPEEGRENYRAMVRAVLEAALSG